MALYDETICRDRFDAAAAAFVSPDRRFSVVVSLPPKSGTADFTVERFLEEKRPSRHISEYIPVNSRPADSVLSRAKHGMEIGVRFRIKPEGGRVTLQLFSDIFACLARPSVRSS